MLGRMAAVLLMAALAGPLAAPWAAAEGAEPVCRDGVCVCAHHGRAKAADPGSCHGQEGGGASRCEMRAACHHQQEGVAAIVPYLLPTVASLSGQRPSVSIPGELAHRPRAGLRSIEPPPPRAS
jgi:hypothetical protein